MKIPKKFRVKHLIDNSYLPSYENNGELFFWEGNFVGVQWFIQCERLESPKRFLVEQFTGTYDKNNREIYEGDIVKSETGYDTITYRLCSFGPYLPLSAYARRNYEVVNNYPEWMLNKDA